IDEMAVPAPLMSGDHKAILKWRRQSALINTQKKRPDLLVKARKNGLLTVEDENFLKSLLQG
ncbi:tRNA (guanosine(37)-N1)-methyltransferase TrmD, partial [Acinetobacter baumannii]